LCPFREVPLSHSRVNPTTSKKFFNTRPYQPGKTETNQKKLSLSEKKKKLNGGVAILLKKNRFWLI
jgi:hypothetical protein